jgi:hypothetical protein
VAEFSEPVYDAAAAAQNIQEMKDAWRIVFGVEVDLASSKPGPKNGAHEFFSFFIANMVAGGYKQADIARALNPSKPSKFVIARAVKAWREKYPKRATKVERVADATEQLETWFFSHILERHPEALERYHQRRKHGFIFKADDVLRAHPTEQKELSINGVVKNLQDFDPAPAYAYALAGSSSARSAEPIRRGSALPFAYMHASSILKGKVSDESRRNERTTRAPRVMGGETDRDGKHAHPPAREDQRVRATAGMACSDS